MDIPTTKLTEPVKFTDEEIKRLADIRTAYEQVTISLGQLEMQKRELEKVRGRINDRATDIEIEEKTLLDEIVKKYGEGQYDPTTGIFTPNKV